MLQQHNQRTEFATICASISCAFCVNPRNANKSDKIQSQTPLFPMSTHPTFFPKTYHHWLSPHRNNYNKERGNDRLKSEFTERISDQHTSLSSWENECRLQRPEKKADSVVYRGQRKKLKPIQSVKKLESLTD